MRNCGCKYVGEKSNVGQVHVYTDGSVLKNPGGIGGWCAIIQADGITRTLVDALPTTTNNRAELTAVVEALSFLLNVGKDSDITIYSDSEYAVKGCNDWLSRWEKNNWKNNTVLNRDLWEKILQFKHKMEFTLVWVESHGSNELNNKADELARECARAYQRFARFRKS
jgi:ribonuclease HI